MAELIEEKIDQSKEDNYLNIDNAPYSLQNTLKKLSSQIDIANNNFQSDKVSYSTQRSILSSLLKLIPVAIDNYYNKPGQSSMNALTGLVTQINDLFQEIKSSQDFENQVNYINEEIIDVLVKDIINDIFEKTYYIKQELKGNSLLIDKNDLINLIFSAFDNQLKSIAPSIDNKKEKAKEKLKQYFIEI